MQMRLPSVNGGPVVEYRLRDDVVERRILPPDGRCYRDGGSDWRPLTEEERRTASEQRTPLCDFLRQTGEL